MNNLSWSPSVGRVIAIVVLLGTLAAAYAHIDVPNLDLWLIGLLAAALIIG